MKSTTVVLSAAALLTLPSFAALKLGAPFADGVVLQRGRAVPVWGTAEAGNEVTVSFAGAEVKAAVGADGAWRVALPAMSASKESRELVVTESERGFFGSTVDERTVRDVLVGEVWVASGQSNMDCPLWAGGHSRYRDANGALVASMTQLPNVRYFKSPRKWSVEPAPIEVAWRKLTAENLAQGKVSAVGFYYARELYLALDIPIGLVDASVGGTNIDAWTPRCGYEGCDPSIRETAEYPVRRDFVRDRDRKGPIGGDLQQPTVLWNGMVDAFAPMAIRGFIWYQGCHNNAESGLYRAKLHALYNGWSRRFENKDLRFYLVQLAPYTQNWVGIAAAQNQFVAEQPNAAIAVTADVGNFADIHPNRKETVAKRLVVHALKRDYGFAIAEDCSPVFRGVTFKGAVATLAFDHVRNWYVYAPDRSHDAAFELAGEDGVWQPAKILNFLPGKDKLGNVIESDLLDGATVVLKSDKVAAPKKVRYMARPKTFGTMFNEASLPLGAFETK